METHFDDFNPWRGKAVYVPVRELAEVLSGYETVMVENGERILVDTETLLAHWGFPDRPLDAYILPQPGGRHCVGLRYGTDPSEYLSLYNRSPHGIASLLERHSAPTPAPSGPSP